MQPDVPNDELTSSKQNHLANLCSLPVSRNTLNLSLLPTPSELAHCELAPQELASSELAPQELASSELAPHELASQPSDYMLSPT